ncbi:hypothetical protein GF358_02405 [Candidatus Woesearchaeota archaeon]|nr:hypothetical protein [Candidatus Woesearchaeota archaeon]
MKLEQYLLDQVFIITANKIYPTDALKYRHDTDSIDFETRAKILSIKQQAIRGKTFDELDSKQLCKAFITAHAAAEKDLKTNQDYEYMKTKTKTLQQIGAEIEHLKGLHGKEALTKGLQIANLIRTVFNKGEIQKEIAKENKKLKQKKFDF